MILPGPVTDGWRWFPHLQACSHHHLRLIKNALFGQFCRLKRTCTRVQDYDEQSGLLNKTFLQKGYDQALIEEAYTEYQQSYADAVGYLPHNNESMCPRNGMVAAKDRSKTPASNQLSFSVLVTTVKPLPLSKLRCTGVFSTVIPVLQVPFQGTQMSLVDISRRKLMILWLGRESEQLKIPGDPW